MFYENGPFVFKENTGDFVINKYGWNLKSNLLYIESPGGVGFSESFRNFTYDDNTSADDNLRAIRKFY
jgi:serine carboxypeptidase-like clade 2